MVRTKSSLYRQELVEQNSDSDDDLLNESDYSDDNSELDKNPNEHVFTDICNDDDDSISSIKEEESDWIDFFYYCIDFTSVNLLYIC